jgi:hypothetical protein
LLLEQVAFLAGPLLANAAGVAPLFALGAVGKRELMALLTLALTQGHQSAVTTLARCVEALAPLHARRVDLGAQESKRSAVLFAQVLSELALEALLVLRMSLHR